MAERERTLLEIALDLKKHPEIISDREGMRDMLIFHIHDSLIATWGCDLAKNFEEALKELKVQLQPCKDAFSDVELRRIIGAGNCLDRDNGCTGAETEGRSGKGEVGIPE